MISGIQGQAGAVSLLQNFLDEKADGRTIILQGDKGTGKFTSAVRFAAELLGKNPFLSADFNFYRNDDFSMKTGFYLEKRKNPKVQEMLPSYLYYLLGRLSVAVALGEIAKSSVKFKKAGKGGETSNVMDFRSELENVLLNNRLGEELENPSFTAGLLAVSDEISKKKRVPIDFIRGTIEFHSLKSPSGKRVTVIGSFESATEEAQNSSLKLFEEPAPGSLILLTAENLGGILPTILSRSIVIKFNPLTPAALETVFGEKTRDKFRSASDHMEDAVYRYSEKAKGQVKEFFTQVAPRIQRENRVFSFIDGITSGDSNKLPVLFLEELASFLRDVFIVRQSQLRSTDLSAFADPEYADIAAGLAEKTDTAELKDLTEEIGEAVRGIRYGNITDAVVLPNILIDLARWYQRRKTA